MKRFLFTILSTMLYIGAWAAQDLTLSVSETVMFGGWGFDNSAAPTLNFSNWSSGGGWVFATPLSQDDYCGVEFTMEATTENHVTLLIVYEDDTDQSVDVPLGSTAVAADFTGDGGIKKIGFKYGDWEDTANENGATITITGAVVKTYSDITLDVSDATAFDSWGFAKDDSQQSITVSNWAGGGGWVFAKPLSQTNYCGVDFTFEATTVNRLTFMIFYENGSTQSIDVPTGSTSVSADFANDGAITKIGFKYGDWDSGVLGDATIIITKAMVKAVVQDASDDEATDLAFSDLGGEVKDDATQSVTFGQYNWSVYWSFDPAIISDDYEKVVFTFAEPIPVSGMHINVETVGDESWCGTTIADLSIGATKATAYFSEMPGADISRIGFFLTWESAEATLKIASAKLYKKPEMLVAISNAEYATYVTTAETDFSLTDGITAYMANVNGGKVELNEVSKVPAGTPVVVKGNAGDYTLHYTLAETDDISANELLVSDGTVTGDESTIYVLANGNNGIGFYLLRNGGKVAEGKAYLSVTAGANALPFIGFGDTTGIDSELATNEVNSTSSVYDLMGRQMTKSPNSQMKRGVYIVNGKKIFIK